MESNKQSYILPARRAQWLVSAMSYAYGLCQPIQNEVVVLATGLDQYLQELFHHLDFEGNESVSREHFLKLLRVLGLRRCKDKDDAGTSCSNGALMDFKEFHRELVQSFLEDNGDDGRMEGKQWSFEGELVEAEVHMTPRQGHSVRTMCSECFCKKPVSEVFHSVLYKQGKLADGDSDKDLINGKTKASKEHTISGEVMRLQEENEGLRELVEDMRQALQSSDAKNLALEVTLSNVQSSDKPPASNLIVHIENTTNGNVVRPEYLTLLTNEFNRLQDKRNVQLEEAMIYTQELEADLWRSRKDHETLKSARASLLQNQQSVTEQLEKAREVLNGGLQRVRFLEEQSSQVEELQSRLQEVQSMLSDDERCCRRQRGSPLRQNGNLATKTTAEYPEPNVTCPDENRISPSGSSCGVDMEDCSSSDPERTGASDEETERQKESSRDGNDGNVDNGTDTMRRARVGEMQAKMDKLRKQLQDTVKEKEDMNNKLDQEKSELLSQLEENTKVTDKYQREIQRLEKERARMFPIENIMKEIIVFLRTVKDFHLSRRYVGKMVMDALEISLRDNGKNVDQDGQVKRFLTCFHKQLQQQSLQLEAKAMSNGQSNSQVSHSASQISSRKTVSSSSSTLSTSSSETYCHSSSSNNSTNSIEVETHFYQFGAIRAGTKGKRPATFKTIKTELGTV